ncbi:MAG: hypothetical protein MJ137_01730 [Clostridia bacterium]|nr:hypothetical protein [Clostridia bacterium]
MKKNVKLTAGLLALLLFATAFISCANTNPGKEDQTTPAPIVDTTTPTETDNKYDDKGYIRDNLPSDLNFGKELTILRWSDVEHEEFVAEEQTGDIVLDSIYTRNLRVEERLGITMKWEGIKGNSDNTSAWNTHLSNMVSSGSDEYDIIAGYSLSVTLNAASGFLTDMLNTDVCPYADFNQPWWSQLLVEQATIKDKLYFASGDISRNALEMMYVCFVNTDLLDSHNLENPQNLVESGKWTFAKFTEMCKGIYEGQGTKDFNTDTFGYMSSGIHNDPWFYASGTLLCEKDADGNIVPSETLGGERILSTIDMLQTLFKSEDGIYTENVNHQNAFRDGRLLFCTDRARCSHKVFAANGDCHYVVVPCPKYDEDMDNYITVLGNPFTLYAIFANSSEKKIASAFIECMASEGYRNVTPAVFEISLKTKYINDPTSAKMYDIIRENITYDLGRLFSSSLAGQGDFRNTLKNNSSWTITVKTLSKKLTSTCKTLMKSFED